MQAHEDGKDIRFKFDGGLEYSLGKERNPIWDWVASDYYIFRKPRTIWVNEYTSGNIGSVSESLSEAIRKEDYCGSLLKERIMYREVINDDE